MTAFKIICSFLKIQEGYTGLDIANRLNVSLDTIKRWKRKGYTIRDVAPKDIVSHLFSNNTTLINAFVPYLKNNHIAISEHYKTSDNFTVEEFEKFLALFLAYDSNNQRSITRPRSKTIPQTRRIGPRPQEINQEMSIDCRTAKTFASCGKEKTVFDVIKSDDEQAIHVDVHFAKTNVRETIPEYAGLYYLFYPVLDIRKTNHIRFKAKSADKTIAKIWVEIKPQGRSWMHESFDLEIGSEYKEYDIEYENFIFPETLSCVEEITFVIKTDSFSNQELLEGQLDMAYLCIQ